MKVSQQKTEKMLATELLELKAQDRTHYQACESASVMSMLL